MAAKKVTLSDEMMNQLLELVLPELQEDEYTGYGVHTELNRVLVANGQEKKPSQMMYNYLRNGMIVPEEKIFGTTLRPVTKLEVAKFLIRYCARNELALTFKPIENKNQLTLDLDSVK